MKMIVFNSIQVINYWFTLHRALRSLYQQAQTFSPNIQGISDQDVTKERLKLNKMKRDSLTKKNEYLTQFYVKILKNNLLEIWTLSLIFMYDNASIHNADIMKLWLEEQSIMKWPSYSSDLNSIEHLWFYLKKMVYKVCLNIEQVHDNDEKIWKALFEALKKAWSRLSDELLTMLIKSMKLRVNAVIKTERWYTQY